MRSTVWYCLAHYLIYFILIDLSDEVPLSGQYVRDAMPNELKYVVSIQTFYGHFCTGILISRRSVLTAAHCTLTYTVDVVQILIGTNDLNKGGKRYQVESWISYEQWSNQTNPIMFAHDIAVITLKERVQEVNAVAISTKGPEDLHCQKVSISGWGRQQSGIQPMVLKTGVVKVISNRACALKIGSLLSQTFSVPEVMFCTSADPWVLGDCGDSGAPILDQSNQLVGTHIAICPTGIIGGNYSTEFVNQNLVNLHVHVYYHRTFIMSVKQD